MSSLSLSLFSDDLKILWYYNTKIDIKMNIRIYNDSHVRIHISFVMKRYTDFETYMKFPAIN